MGFPRQEYWSGLPFPSLGNLPNPEIEPASLALLGEFFTSKPPGKPPFTLIPFKIKYTDGNFLHFFKKFIYLAAVGLSCSMWDLVP